MESSSALLFLALLGALASSSSASVLTKDPPEDKVMISDKHRGVKLACFFNQTGEEEGQGEGEEKDDAEITWWRQWSSGAENGLRQQIEAEHVKVKEDGRSQVRLPEDLAREGTITCQSGGEGGDSLTWAVQPHFKLEAMPKSKYVSEGEDVYLDCTLRAASIVDGDLSFKWTRVEEHDAENITDLPTQERNEHGDLHTTVK